MDKIIARPAKRNKEFTAELNTTATPHDDTPASGSRDAASLTKNEAEKSVLAENAFASTCHTQTPTPTNYGVLVGRETIALTPIEGHFTATPHTTAERRVRKKKKSGHTNRTHRDRESERERMHSMSFSRSRDSN